MTLLSNFFFRDGMYDFQNQMKEIRDQLNAMKGSMQQILLHIPDINQKIRRVNNFPFQICYDMDNCFNHLNGRGRACDSKMHDIIQDVNKHDNLVKIHE